MRYWLIAACVVSGWVQAAGEPPVADTAVVDTAVADRPAAIRHEHGSSTLRITVDGDRVTVQLAGPADNFLGFEHQPSTPAQRTLLRQALDDLRAGAALFPMSPEADCRLASAAASPPAYTVEGHSDLQAYWAFRCGRPAALLWVEARVFEKFPATTRLVTKVSTPDGRKEVVLTPGTTRLLMPRRN